MASIQEIASVLRSIAKPGMKPKALRTAIQEQYPDASKKEIVRAAFYALADSSSATDEDLTDLHQFALTERGSDAAPAVALKGSSRKRKRDRETADRAGAH